MLSLCGSVVRRSWVKGGVVFKVVSSAAAIVSTVFSLAAGTCSGSPPVVSDLGSLEGVVNGAWTNETISRAVPPTPFPYNTDLGVVSFASNFDTNFLSILTPVTNGTVTLYPLLVTETNASPRERVFLNASSVAVHTASVDLVDYPEAWVQEVYGAPPAWFSGNTLSNWYAIRDPSRQRVRLSLLATSDVPAYVAALTNSLASVGSGTNAVPLLDLYSNDIAFVGMAAGEGSPALYLHAPEEVARLDLFDSTSLVAAAGGWWLAATLDHAADPLAWSAAAGISNAFYCAGDADTDTDADGLSDIRELRLYGTDLNESDTDGDGLSDGEEVLTYDLDPLDADSDGDGIEDGDEIVGRTGPHNADASAPIGTIVCPASGNAGSWMP